MTCGLFVSSKSLFPRNLVSDTGYLLGGCTTPLKNMFFNQQTISKSLLKNNKPVINHELYLMVIPTGVINHELS